MKTASYGRFLFGASAVLFGIIGLMWHDAETWQSMSSIWKLPLGTIVGEFLMVVQIAGGLGLLFTATTRVGSILLAVVYALFSLACIPGIVASPKVFGEYDGFFEQFSLLCGALAAYGIGAARIGFGISVISFTLAQAIYLRETAALVPAWLPPNQLFWAILTTIAFALAAIAMLINREARLAFRLISAMLVIFGVLVWVPRLIARPDAHLAWSEFALTFLIAGAAAVIADTI
jgi:hypothetical protein